MNFCTKKHPLIKCSFSYCPIYFSIQLIVYSFKGKDLVEVPMIPPLKGLGNDTFNPLDLSSVNGLGNLIPPSLMLSLLHRLLSLIIDYKVST